MTGPPKSIADMTADERRALLRRRTARPSDNGMEIGPRRLSRRVRAAVGGAAAAVIGVVVVAAVFVHFTASWRVAGVIAAGMLAAALLLGRLTEGQGN